MNMTEHHIHVHLNGCKEGLMALRDLAEKMGSYACLDKIRLNRMVLAMDELFANIHEHGYRFQGGRVECFGRCVEKSKRLYQLEITMRDYAPVIKGIDCCVGTCPETLKDNPTAGGLGMGLIKATTERFEHMPLADGNQWLLVFDVQAQEDEDDTTERKKE